MKARLLGAVGVLALTSGRVAAEGPWGIQPLLGVSGDYETNPFLLSSGAHSEQHAAALIDLPLRYDSDELEFLFRPNGRLTNSEGYASVASNYEHLDVAAQYADERNSVTVQGEAARDSSLYYVGGLQNRLGVPRNTALTSADWTYSTTERSQAQLDASWIKVHYDEPADLNFLTAYRYWSSGPTFAYQSSERNTLKVLGTYSVYDSLDGATQSISENLQLGLVRQLTEIWSLSGTAGYSKSRNSEHFSFDYFGFIIPVSERSTQNSSVYSASISRQGERFNLSASFSRALQPTGFSFLSLQNSVNLKATYVQSEYWDFGVLGVWIKAINPPVGNGRAQLSSPEQTNRYLNTQFSVNYHWTSQWSISVIATRISQEYGPPSVSAGSTGLAINVVRQFLRTQF